ncbi:TetR/AcrR family transcriptional regulator [Streptomyces somaliensis DSM 40738]|uniref:TetR/AcrR family transcriptional regulator n=1 Tax=Streptomyces somaliensis (strain ATCC 33201 / DSM 40738 / JCM 12659 / KCTC 9044 / NCTC 11332 / NRRL B-12077 / IP 733) TaxID=1134445 RepID=A0AA44IEH9_STRE0|nr:TetR/AcrR family transcriptional regulator [Streptomyces somaliensis]MCQ0024661.1 TetR/AcrR family transcriptional regulator [Streptomyces somaliensis DSM 40738]NKY15353.1 TetR/AcrR family transcriptional regulator [Streptomyces somaliensis DSM 40738]
MAAAADRDTKRPARTSVWLDGRAAAPRGRRTGGDQPSGLDRVRITAAAVRLLDAEGLAKFSMRRLAAELNVTAMSLYWYVDSKDDLLELASDAVVGEVVLPDLDGDPDADWRDQLRGLAQGYRALLVRHPWLSPLMGRFLNIGPNWSGLSLCVLRLIRRTGLPPERQAGGIAAVFQFVYGFGTIEGHFRERCAEAGLSQDEYFTRAMGAIDGRPEMARVMDSAREVAEARGGGTVEDMRDRDFAFAVELLISGIEAQGGR